MPTLFDGGTPTQPAPLTDGVACFDPVTLQLAADALSHRGCTVHLPATVKGQVPRALASLCTIEMHPQAGVPMSVVATIDTGKLTWALKASAARRSPLAAYDGRSRYGVCLGRLPVLCLDEVMVTKAPMRMPDGAAVTVWFAEVHEPLADLGSYGFLERVRGWMRTWRGPAPRIFGGLFGRGSHTIWADVVTVPAQDFTYTCDLAGVDVQEWSGVGGASTQQKFAATLDESGARVIAQTAMASFAMPGQAPPAPLVYKTFGERGPVVVWFTEGSRQLPFSIMYTTAEAWLAPTCGSTVTRWRCPTDRPGSDEPDPASSVLFRPRKLPRADLPQ